MEAMEDPNTTTSTSTSTDRRAVPVSSREARGPVLDFVGLDVLWLQVTGTVCNLACTHCFITCGPKNDSHPVMATDDVLSSLARAEREGVKELYFTGGEPFLHPDILLLIERALAVAPLSVLTNGVLIDPPMARRLHELSEASAYSLELRVSVDGTTPEENDPVRGRGTYHAIMRGARCLVDAGLLPVFTVTTVHAVYDRSDGREAFLDHLRHLGFTRPRVKFIPPFDIGRQARRSSRSGDRTTTSGVADEVREDSRYLRPDDLHEGEEWVLQCGSCRTVTARGVYPCPILIEEDGARMSDDLDETFVPIELNHSACTTCHLEGFSCRT